MIIYRDAPVTDPRRQIFSWDPKRQEIHMITGDMSWLQEFISWDPKRQEIQ